MTVFRRLLAGAAAGTLLFAAGGGFARSGFAAPPRPTILGVRADLVADTVTITGSGFGAEAPPVALGGVPLVVTSSSDDTLVAALPEGSAGANHRLVVGAGSRSDSADIWIPGEGIVTRGPIRIESTESDVMIVAGGSRVSIDASGRVTLRGTGLMEVHADGALDLRGGNTVSIRSGSSMTLNAGTVLNATSAAGTSVGSSAITSVTGSLVRLN